MVERAEQIFSGRVEAVKSDWALRGGRKCIVTTVSFLVEKMYKGVSVRRTQLEFLGGTVGSESMEVQGVPRFSTGERVILFTEGNGRQFCPLVGVYHGKLVIKREISSGTDLVLRHDGRPVTKTEEVGAGEVSEIAASGPIGSRPPMSVEAFIEGLTSEIRKETRP